ncbi:MAG: hypothetical protein ACRC35_14605 [Angustibacter sp.]
MIALGIILLVVAVLLVVGVAVGGPAQDVTFDTFAGDITTTVWWVFVTGAVTVLIGVLGVGFAWSGMRRRRAQRQEIRRLRQFEQEAVGNGGAGQLAVHADSHDPQAPPTTSGSVASLDPRARFADPPSTSGAGYTPPSGHAPPPDSPGWR